MTCRAPIGRGTSSLLCRYYVTFPSPVVFVINVMGYVDLVLHALTFLQQVKGGMNCFRVVDGWVVEAGRQVTGQ